MNTYVAVATKLGSNFVEASVRAHDTRKAARESLRRQLKRHPEAYAKGFKIRTYTSNEFGGEEY